MVGTTYRNLILLVFVDCALVIIEVLQRNALGLMTAGQWKELPV